MFQADTNSEKSEWLASEVRLLKKICRSSFSHVANSLLRAK